jgi:hypothetical protein
MDRSRYRAHIWFTFFEVGGITAFTHQLEFAFERFTTGQRVWGKPRKLLARKKLMQAFQGQIGQKSLPAGYAALTPSAFVGYSLFKNYILLGRIHA